MAHLHSRRLETAGRSQQAHVDHSHSYLLLSLVDLVIVLPLHLLFLGPFRRIGVPLEFSN